MNGPEHYREAERLANRANHFTYGDGGDPAVGLALAAEAQVHATLALAAATALQTVTLYVGDSNEVTRWAHIVNVLPLDKQVVASTTSRACRMENCDSCAGCGCGCHAPRHTCIPFDPPEQRRAECQPCRDEAAQEAEK